MKVRVKVKRRRTLLAHSVVRRVVTHEFILGLRLIGSSSSHRLLGYVATRNTAGSLYKRNWDGVACAYGDLEFVLEQFFWRAAQNIGRLGRLVCFLGQPMSPPNLRSPSVGPGIHALINFNMGRNHVTDRRAG